MGEHEISQEAARELLWGEAEEEVRSAAGVVGIELAPDDVHGVADYLKRMMSTKDYDFFEEGVGRVLVQYPPDKVHLLIRELEKGR